jgi:ribosomal protein L37AE/L43A
MYFEPLKSLELNSQINIIMPNYSPDTDGPEAYQSYLAAIRWCQKLSDEKSARFGVGVEIIERSHERFIDIKTKKRQTCDLCDKLMLTASVCRLDGSICLCQDCYHRLDEMPEGDIKSSIKRYYLDVNVL